MLRRSPLLLAALLAYPVVIALLVGLVAGYASSKPRVAWVDEDNVPPVVQVAGHRFHVQTIVDQVSRNVTLVRMSADEAARELASGEVVATITVPPGFVGTLETAARSPSLVLRTGSGALASRVTQQVQALVYRLNRDIRFSRDKRPYKSHVAALLWDGAEKHDAPGVYLHVSAAEVMFGGGIYSFEDARLDRWRKLLHAPASAARLESALDAAKEGGLKLEISEKLQRPARGFDPEGPYAELSRFKGLAVVKRSKPASWLHRPEALDRAESAARAYAPLHVWMRDELCP